MIKISEKENKKIVENKKIINSKKSSKENKDEQIINSQRKKEEKEERKKEYKKEKKKEERKEERKEEKKKERREERKENILIVKNLTKKFGNLVAVNDVSFEIKKGEIIAFLGPNGAGKSTTIKMLTTLLSPDSGQIIMNGHDSSKHPEFVRKTFGIVFQDPSVDEELTAYENLYFHGILYHMHKDLIKKRIDQLLKIVELEDRKKDYVKHFSGGMKRRLEIARGLMHHPTIFFLDEPTVGLDPQTRNNIWEHIKKLNKEEGITIFFTTHYMDEAEKVADRIAIIDHGKIIIQGTSKELKQKTNKKTLEEAFIKLTGKNIREEEASTLDQMRMRRKMFRR